MVVVRVAGAMVQGCLSLGAVRSCQSRADANATAEAKKGDRSWWSSWKVSWGSCIPCCNLEAAVGVVLVSVEGKRERQEGEKRISHIEEWEGERGSAWAIWLLNFFHFLPALGIDKRNPFPDPAKLTCQSSSFPSTCWYVQLKVSERSS